MAHINLKQLAEEIRVMNRQHGLYRVLRDELTALGFWRQKPRGNPSKGYAAMKEKQQAKSTGGN